MIPLPIRILPDVAAVAEEAARSIAREALQAVDVRGRFVLAVSGGRTPWQMLRVLADERLPWNSIHVVQVDERVAPAGDVDRNWTHLAESLLARAPIPAEHLHPMPVELNDLEAAAARYARRLEEIAGDPPVVDLVHLGLGSDGHTASLVPGSEALDVIDRDVAVTGEYQGRRRMTLTFPVLNRARRILWVVTGGDKRVILARLRADDRTIPAGQIERARAEVLADRSAAALLDGV